MLLLGFSQSQPPEEAEEEEGGKKEEGEKPRWMQEAHDKRKRLTDIMQGEAAYNSRSVHVSLVLQIFQTIYF